MDIWLNPFCVQMAWFMDDPLWSKNPFFFVKERLKWKNTILEYFQIQIGIQPNVFYSSRLKSRVPELSFHYSKRYSNTKLRYTVKHRMWNTTRSAAKVFHMRGSFHIRGPFFGAIYL